MNDTICKYVFNSISISNVIGMIDPCCAPSGPHTKWYHNKMLVIHDDFNEVLNNTQIVKLRKSMIAEEKNPLCDTCWQSEGITGKSERTLGNSNLRNSDVYNEIIDFSNIFHINLFLGNKCNLACRMCSPFCSSLIAKQTDIIYQRPPTSIIPVVRPNSNVQEFNDDTQKRIIEFIDNSENLEKIHMYGGEPLINDFYDLICSHLIANGRASKITLDLSTNLQVDLERKNELHRHFKNVHIAVSVDGEGDTYEYIRWPGNWNKIQNNLKILSNTRNDFSISVVVQNLNIDNISNLLVYLSTIENFECNNTTYRRVSMVNDIKIIPTWIIEREIERLKALNQPMNHNIHLLVKMLEAEVEPSRNLEYKEVANFFKQQKDWDSIRNQNLFTTKPHFLELAKQFNIEPW